MPTILDLGQKVKQKYPGMYDDLSDVEVGQKVKQKYPGSYDDFADVQQGPFKYEVPTLQPTPEQRKSNLINAQTQTVKAQKESDYLNSTRGLIKETLKGAGKTLISSEIGLGKTIAKTMGTKNLDTYNKNIENLVNSQIKTQRLIKEWEAQGKDTTNLKRAFNSNQDLIEQNKAEINKFNDELPTSGQVVGQIGGTALDLLTAGTYGTAAKGMKTGGLAKSSIPFTQKAATSVGLPEVGKLATQKASGLFTKQGLKNIGTGASIGYASDVSQGLQGFRGEDRTGGKAFIPGLGTAIGTGLPVISEGAQTYKNIKSPSPERINSAVSNLESKYVDWSTGTKPGKKLVNKVIQKTEMLNKAGTTGKTPMRTLAESGIVPETKGVKFNTFDQAGEYRNSIRPLQEANKSALQEAGLSTVPSRLDDLEQKAIDFARTKENINSGRASKMEREIRNEFNILRSEYPDGNIPLGLQDDIKSARWGNVFGNKGLIDADVLKKDSEYAIAKAFQKNIEEVADQAGHKEVAQLNREIGDRLEASKFLESLDGKVLKGGRVGKYVGTLIGSSLGQSIPGKIVGALGGNVAADLLIKSSVSSPVRRAILSNLQKTDPEAYIMTIKWLADQDLARGTRLALPSGKGSPIELPGEKITSYESPAQVINRQKQPDQLLLSEGNPNMSNINQGRPINVFPRGSKEYVGTETTIGGYSKSPTIQQTNPAITNVIKNPISDIIPQTGNKVQGVQISKKALELTRKNGGATINLDGDVPTKGFAYSPFKDVETVIPKEKFNESHVDDFINKHFDKLDQDGHHLGIWEDDGKVYIDISKVNPDEQLAVADSIKNNQLGLFDLSTFETKYIKDYEKTNNAYIHKGQNQGASKEGSIGTIAKEASKEINKTWYHGTDSLNKNGDTFYSSSKDIASDYGKVSKIKDLPKNPLIIGSKEDLAPVIGYKGDPLVEPKIPKGKSFDELAKEYAKSKGYDSIMYKSGTFDEPELHVFKQSKESGQIKNSLLLPIAGVSALGIFGNALLKKNKQDKQKTIEYKPINRSEFAKKLVNVENEGNQNKDLYKVVGSTNDLGKYQVSPTTLKNWSKVFLNKEYTPKEFLNDKNAQEKFYNEFMNISDRLKLTPNQTAIMWHMGFGDLGKNKNVYSREQRDKIFLENLQKNMNSNEGKRYLLKFNR